MNSPQGLDRAASETAGSHVRHCEPGECLGFPPLGVRIAKVFTDSNLAVQIAHGVWYGGSRVTVSLSWELGRTHTQ